MLFLALVGSMILGAIGILIRELLRGRIYSGADVERMLGLQPLAKIPLFSDVSPFPVVEKDALYFDKNGTFEQAAFSVRRWAEAISAPRNTIVAVVSEAAGDGRSTVAAALAFGAARAGRKTLLVDADFRDRALTRTLAADTESGLAQAGSGDVPAVVSRLGERLPDFCGAVLSGTETPLGVLDSPAIAEFLANARETYDLTVVDTAAFGPYVDASAIVDLADGVLVVLRSGVTTQVTADNIMKEIAAVGAKPVGVVLNMVPRSGINRLRDVVPEAWVRMFSEKFDALKSRIRAAA